MLTLTFVAILFVALLAHVSGGRATHGGEGIARALDSRAILACVFLTTFGVLWYSWAAWNPIPVVHDEMAYVFQAQVFARGIWALPAPPFPAFWEQPHFLIEPTVTIKYFPGHPLVLAVGALVGWMALMPLVLQSSIAVLLYVLARRVSSGAVALLAWVIWLFTPMVLYFGASYFSEATPAIFGQRVLYLFISTWGVTSGLLGVFAVLGLLTVGAEVAFAVGSGLLLIVAYLAYATPARWTLYYYETVPAFTYLSAAGLAWAASMIGRPRGTPQSLSFNWRSPRWTRALVAGALVIGLPGIVALRIIRGQHVSDRKCWRDSTSCSSRSLTRRPSCSCAMPRHTIPT